MATLKSTKNIKARQLMKSLGYEKLITSANGDVEFVAIPISAYEKLLELIEDYGLGLAMKAAEGEKVYSKDEALRFLENA